MKPAYADNWATIYSVDALTGLQELPERSVHCAITSPPYWSLRSYLPADHPDKAMELGAEPTPELYVERLVEVLRALRRVLRDDATLWLNLGDSYNSLGGTVGGAKYKENGGLRLRQADRKSMLSSLKPKDLIGIPWMVAFALRADGWVLRQEITWCKKAPMPESVTDRPSSATEKLFLFTKKPRYFYDAEAVKEKCVKGAAGSTFTEGKTGINGNGRVSDKPREESGSRNLRNYWILGPSPYNGAHYATMPAALVYPCIKAGTSERGVCEACGAPWERVVEKTGKMIQQQNGPGTAKAHIEANGKHGESSSITTGFVAEKKTVGWQPTCECNGEYIKEPYEVTVVNRKTGKRKTVIRYRSVYIPGIPLSEHPVVPATVLDPFMGSGTTALAARKFGRRSIGLDLDERNMKQVKERLGPQGVFL